MDVSYEWIPYGEDGIPEARLDAWVDKTMVGSLTIEFGGFDWEDDYYVANIWVEPDWQRKGIATGMYEEAQKRLGQPIQHDIVQTDEGSAWAEHTSSVEWEILEPTIYLIWDALEEGLQGVELIEYVLSNIQDYQIDLKDFSGDEFYHVLLNAIKLLFGEWNSDGGIPTYEELRQYIEEAATSPPSGLKIPGWGEPWDLTNPTADPRFKGLMRENSVDDPQGAHDEQGESFFDSLKTAMAERTGDPELDALIEEFMQTTFEPEQWPDSWEELDGMLMEQYDSSEIYEWDLPEIPVDAFRHPGISEGMCYLLSEKFMKFLNENGIEAGLSGDLDNLEDWASNTPNAFGYEDRTMLPDFGFHHWVIARLSSGIYGIDFTASQFGYKEFPMVQKLDDQGGWQRKWSSIFDKEHKKLDQKVFMGEKPRSTVVKFIEEKFNQIFKDNFGFEVEPYIHLFLTGSLTTYQYNPHSDFDVSVFVDYDRWPTRTDPETLRDILVTLVVDKLDGTYIPGSQHPLQFFIIPHGIKPIDKFQAGIRSAWDFKSKQWFVPPDRRRVHNVKEELPAMYMRAFQIAEKMNTLLDTNPPAAIDLFKRVRRKRKLDQEKYKLGDWSEGNVVWKFLAHAGTFDRLRSIGVKIASPVFPDETGEIEDQSSLFFNDVLDQEDILYVTQNGMFRIWEKPTYTYSPKEFSLEDIYENERALIHVDSFAQDDYIIVDEIDVKNSDDEAIEAIKEWLSTFSSKEATDNYYTKSLQYYDHPYLDESDVKWDNQETFSVDNVEDIEKLAEGLIKYPGQFTEFTSDEYYMPLVETGEEDEFGFPEKLYQTIEYPPTSIELSADKWTTIFEEFLLELMTGNLEGDMDYIDPQEIVSIVDNFWTVLNALDDSEVHSSARGEFSMAKDINNIYVTLERYVRDMESHTDTEELTEPLFNMDPVGLQIKNPLAKFTLRYLGNLIDQTHFANPPYKPYDMPKEEFKPELKDYYHGWGDRLVDKKNLEIPQAFSKISIYKPEIITIQMPGGEVIQSKDWDIEDGWLFGEFSDGKEYSISIEPDPNGISVFQPDSFGLPIPDAHSPEVNKMAESLYYNDWFNENTIFTPRGQQRFLVEEDWLDQENPIHHPIGKITKEEFPMLLLYDFNKDTIILGINEKSADAHTHIVGEYMGKDAILYPEHKDWFSPYYFKKLWAHSFKDRPLDDIFIMHDGEVTKAPSVKYRRRRTIND